MHYVVSGAPDGKINAAVIVEDGRIVSVEPGKVIDPDITVSLTYDEALAIASGKTTADESYMRGATKVEGDHAAWLLDLRDVREPVIEAVTDLG